MRLQFKWVFIFALFALTSPIPVLAAVIFQDNFDSCSQNCTSSSLSAPPGWGQWYGPVSASIGGVTHYAGEITSPGRGDTGKSFKMWRAGSNWSDYNGALVYYMDGSSSEIFMRYYVKIPKGMDLSQCSGATYQKMWRFNTSGSASEIYLDMIQNGGSLKNTGELAVMTNTHGWETVLNHADLAAIWDGNWHSWEWHINLSTGLLELWIDDIAKYSRSGWNFGGGQFKMMQHFNLGNHATGCSWQSDWQAMEMDDFVLSTTAVGKLVIASPIEGVCGLSSGKTFTSLTSVSAGLCSSGTVASFSGSGPWTWGCNGANGGTSTSSTACSALLTSPILTVPAPPPPTTSPAPTQALLFSESFENNSFASRGWYDNTSHGTIVSGGQAGNSLQWAWASGATTPTNGGSMRMAFTPTDSLYLSYYVKFQSGWRGSQKAYHPHMLYILSDLDNTAAIYSPLANNYLNTYIEFVSDVGSPYTIRPVLAIQDEKRVNIANGTPPNNLTAITENRSVAYCNTPVPAGATGTCYPDNPYYSANTWNALTASVSTNAWHHVEVYFKMNSIVGGKGQSNGIMQEWIDGVQVINQSNVLYRTNQDATKKWAQFVLAPYIGDGSPIAQSMWIDELTVGTLPPTGKVPISAPTGLKIK